MEIYYNSTWGTVCDDLWDINDAQVVCRQLGYPSAVSAPLYARFARGSGRIWLENVQCQGNENYIRHCRGSRLILMCFFLFSFFFGGGGTCFVVYLINASRYTSTATSKPMLRKVSDHVEHNSRGVLQLL